MTPSYPDKLLPKQNFTIISDDSISPRGFLLRQIRNKHQINTLKTLRERTTNLMSASEFHGGISCNLLGVYKIKHSYFLPSSDKQLGLTDYWKIGDSPKRPQTGAYKYYNWQGYFGFNIKRLYEFRAEFPRKNAKGRVVRTDTCLIKIKHAPTYCNYWHFNLFLYAENSETKEIYDLKDPIKGVSKSQLEKIATGLIDDFSELLLLGKKLRPIYIAKNKYQNL